MLGPIVLPLPRAELARQSAIRRLVTLALVKKRARSEVVSAFDFKDAELAFARALTARANLWLWRVHQRAFGGDFVVVDVSAPRPQLRPVLAIDLKRGERVRVDRPGVQMQHAPRAVSAIAAEGVVAADATPLYVTGDAAEVLSHMPRLLALARAARSV